MQQSADLMFFMRSRTLEFVLESRASKQQGLLVQLLIGIKNIIWHVYLLIKGTTIKWHVEKVKLFEKSEKFAYCLLDRWIS